MRTKSFLELPQVEATFSKRSLGKVLVFVAGGRRPDKKWLSFLVRKGYPFWAVDRGLIYCLEAGITPTLYIGDKDSISEEELTRAQKTMVELVTYPTMKDLTDLQLALKEASNRCENASILLTGCWGGRFDHLYSIVHSAVWADEWGISTIAMADDKEILYFLKGKTSISLDFKKLPKNISLLALSDHCIGVSIDNVVWPLQEYTLSQHHPFAVSNKLHPSSENQGINVSVQKGWLGVYLNF
ncbi:thiamine diphosphokinase [Thermovirga lienii]|uniref:thiamine diphosphokinase n=1 Tax=Thermovirga lienii TaxID=336261 RepID=UPI000EE6DF45|nr:thiamine diphosphokinase [Thermovirga lienii]